MEQELLSLCYLQERSLALVQHDDSTKARVKDDWSEQEIPEHLRGSRDLGTFELNFLVDFEDKGFIRDGLLFFFPVFAIAGDLIGLSAFEQIAWDLWLSVEIILACCLFLVDPEVISWSATLLPLLLLLFLLLFLLYVLLPSEVSSDI